MSDVYSKARRPSFQQSWRLSQNTGILGVLFLRRGLEGFGLGGGIDFGRAGIRGALRGHLRGKAFGGDLEPALTRGAAFGRSGGLR